MNIKPMSYTLQQAMRLMRSGDLTGATRALKLGLAADLADECGPRAASWPPPDSRAAPADESTNCIDGEFRVIDDGPSAAAACRNPADGLDGVSRSERFACSAGALDYRLFIPAGLNGRRAPLLLMLHGCTQSPDDFALGTRMNLRACEHGYVVAYPQQSASRNQNRCWNWFRGDDQQRGGGEPAMLAALTRHLIAQHGLDGARVYVAGLSAGGAMAAVLASTHPDVYAAIGVHSELPIGLASDVPSAFAAMRSGKPSGRSGAGVPAPKPVPAIVFHGDADTTVHPRNGEAVIAQSLGAMDAGDAASRAANVERGVSAGGRRYTRTVHAQHGRVSAEHWLSHGAAHAWSGGDPAGSYTDPSGPDASAQMLRFFDACARPAGD